MAPKKKLSPWIQFVMKVKAEHPEKEFKDVLKLAAKLKKEGKTGDVVAKKTRGATRKMNGKNRVRGTASKSKKRKNRKNTRKN